MSAPDEAGLVERCRAGDQAAWAEFVERYSRYVYAIISRGFRLQDPDAEDVFQDVFAAAFTHLGELRDPSAVQAWLAQLTRRRCIDRQRKAVHREEPRDTLPEQVDDAWMEQLDDALTVHRALDDLPENCHEVLDRFFCRDQSYHAIGSALDIAPGTVASRVSRCLARMRELLGGRDPGADTSGGR